MPFEVKAYQCQWCRKVSRTMAGIVNHEARCHANPEFNDCRNCARAYLREDPDLAELFGPNFGYAEPFCEYHGRYIFSEFKSENAYLLDCKMQDGAYDGPDMPIPYTCYEFKSKGKHGFVSYEEWLEKYKEEDE